MDCFLTRNGNGTTAFTGVVPFFAKEIFGFAVGRNRTIARNTFVALPGQTALLDGIVDGKVKISYAGPRVGNGVLH